MADNKVSALVLDLPGAPDGWHMVDGLNGLVHPIIPVPHLDAEGFVAAFDDAQGAAREAWDKFEREREKAGERVHGRQPFPAPPCPVKLVKVSRRQAEEGAKAHAEARRAASGGLREARKSSDDGEAVLAHNEAAVLAGGEE